jgi:hypothetical protein
LWRAAYELEPWGEEREDYRAAVLARVYAGAHGGKLTVKDALEMLNPWEKAQLAKPMMPVGSKIRLFNAGIRGARKGR